MNLLQVPLLKRLKRKKRFREEVSLRDDKLDGWYCTKSGNLAPGFPIGPQDTYLDVGCGDGVTIHFAAAMGAALIATDIDRACVEAKVKKLQEVSPRSIKGYVSDSNPLPIESNSCTRVLSMEVMEHVDDPRQFMQELTRVTAPGGLILVSVPDPASESIQKVLAPDCYWKQPNHVRILQRDEFKQIFVDAGLTVISHTHLKFFSTMYWSLFWAAQQELGDPEKPVLHYWRKTWTALLDLPQGLQVKQTLDAVLPKSQCIIARKPTN